MTIKFFLQGNYPDFKIKYSRPCDIHKIITAMRPKSSPLNTIPLKTLKQISPHISPILSLLINKSIAVKRFPKCLKLSRVIPIHKGGDPEDVNNHRPISLLPVDSKIFEKFICTNCKTIYLPTILSQVANTDSKKGFQPQTQ